MKATTSISICLLLISNLLLAQIPNNGFENWTTTGSPAYEDPDGWNTINGSTNVLGIYTATKASLPADIHGGSFATRLETYYISIVNQTAPGIMSNGIINTTTQSIDGGTAYTGRPDAFTFWYKYAPASGDSCEINFVLYKWNTNTNQRDMVGGGQFRNSQTVSTYTQVTLPVNYLLGINPDTMVIIISSSNSLAPVAGSVLFVDDLGLLNYSPLSVSAPQVNPECNGNCTGTVTVSASGGLAPYTYQWTGLNQESNIDSIADSLCAGNLSVSVFDAMGNQFDTSFVLTNNVILAQPSISSTTENCGQSDGSITATPVIPGTYTYLWNDPSSQFDSTAIGLSAGTYTVTITNQNGCYASSSGSIASSGGLSATILQQTNVSCVGGTNGSATVGATGGQTPYTYQWDAAANNQISAQATGLSAGSYVVTVSDSNACSYVTGATITEPGLALAINGVNVDPLTCYGDLACAYATVTGGTPPYTYDWSIGNTFNPVCGLSAGTYTLTVSDSLGCTANQSFIVGPQPDSITIITSVSHETIFGANDGVLSATVSGGTPPYTYNWQDANSATVNDTAAVAPGDYTFGVLDANNCVKSITVTVNPAPNSIAERNLIKIDIYPNPANETISLNLNQQAGELVIYNILGKAIISTQVKAGTNTIAVNSLNAGIYLIELKDGINRIGMAKLVINR